MLADLRTDLPPPRRNGITSAAGPGRDLTPGSNLATSIVAPRRKQSGRVSEWPKEAGCKPVGVCLRWFESNRAQSSFRPQRPATCGPFLWPAPGRLRLRTRTDSPLISAPVPTRFRTTPESADVCSDIKQSSYDVPNEVIPHVDSHSDRQLIDHDSRHRRLRRHRDAWYVQHRWGRAATRHPLTRTRVNPLTD